MPEPADPEPTRRFTERAADYARYRPDYPAGAIDLILAGLAAPATLVAADIGAGTGISARQLGDRGLRVLAIEPNAAMRAAALAHERVEWRAGTAEATGLDVAAVDLVLCAQAFHWFDVPAATAEFRRVLRPGGRLALLWNKRSRVDPFTRGYRAVLQATDSEAPAERSEFDPDVVDATGRFTNRREGTTPHGQRLTLDGLIGRVMSTSTVALGGPRRDDLLQRLRELHGEFADDDGLVTLVYDSRVFLWD